ncbi:MAG: DUF1295 domain-containing protein [Bacteroidia bacterium]
MNYRYILLIVLIVVPAIFLFMYPLPFGEAFLMILSVLAGLWLLSLAIKDASIIDIFWGPGFVILAWFYFWHSPGPGSQRSVLLCSMVTIWGLRLAWHIGRRNLGKGEDFRYKGWREAGGKNYWWISFLRVFLLQGILMWIISSPLMMAMSDSMVFSLTTLDKVGIALWVIGFGFEAVGDRQLKQFKANPENAGKVMDQGLWRFTRHPNYFGDALLWWGYFMFALDQTGGWIFIFSPVLMTFLLMQVSGVALLEKTLSESKPAYRAYIGRTSAFFPWFPGK